MKFFLPKRVSLFFAAVLLFGAIVITLASSHVTSRTNRKITDVNSIKQLLANPAYAAQVDFFLKLDGIPGESTDSTHKDEIVLDSFQWGSLSHSSTGSATGGAGAGKVKFQDLHITKKVDKASPKLFLACASGKHIKSGIIAVRKAGGDPQDFLILTFSDLLCSSYQQKGDPQNLIPEDSVSLNFSKVKVDYHPQNPTGTTSASETAEFDFNQNNAQ